MAQANRDKTQPWIASDLLNSRPKSYAYRFERDTCFARIIITENGECLLEDGHHKIPAVFSTASSGSWDWNSQRQLSQLKHGTTIRVLEYTYSVFREKDDNFQFAVAVDHWEHTASVLNAGWGHSIDVNSTEAVRKYLQGYLLARSGMNNSSSFLHQSNSQNISHLARLVNQSDSQNLASQSDHQNLANQSGSQNLFTLARLANQSNSQNLANQNDSQNLTNQSGSQNLFTLARLANQSNSQNLANQSDSQNLTNQSGSQNLFTLARLANQSNSQNLANQSDSQNLTNQSNSQNLSILTRLANQSSSSLAKLTNQAVDTSPIPLCHQQYISVGSGTEWIMESGTEWIKPANSTSRDSSTNIPSVASSTWTPAADMSAVHMKETSSCTKTVSRSSNKSTTVASQDSCCQEGNIKHHGSLGNKLVPESHQDQTTLSEESISPAILLELMAQESMHDSSEKFGKEKVNHSGTDENKQPHDCQKSSTFLGRECELQTPTFWDLFVPSDQMKNLAQLSGWTSSNESSIASFPSTEFLRLSSSEKTSSSDSGSLFSQPTLKGDRTHGGYFPDMNPVSSQPTDGDMKASSAENVNQNRKDSILNLKIDTSKFCDRQNSNESELGKDNSSSLFSDAEHNVSYVVENVDVGLKPDGKNLVQQHNSMLAGIESNIVMQEGITLKSNKGNVFWQCNEKEIQRSDEQVVRQIQVSKRDSTQANTDSETNLKSFSTQQENRRSLENQTSSAVSKRQHKTTCSERNSVIFTEQNSDSPCVNLAVMSHVIDLSSSSSDDIYVIAGYDIDSNSENLVSSTEPTDSEHLILSANSKNSVPSIDSGNVLLTYLEKLVSSSSDSQSPMISTDSQSPITSTDSKIATQHIACFPSPGTKSLIHIQPSLPPHTPAGLDAISTQQRTQNNDTDKCPFETAHVLMSSVPSTKACINMPSSETTRNAGCRLQVLNNTCGCQETSRFDSLCWHKEAGVRHTIHSLAKCGGSTSSPSCLNSASKRSKSAARQIVSENIKTAVEQKKPNKPLPTQKSQLQKTMAPLDRPQRKKMCQFKESASVGKSFSGISGQCEFEVPGSQPRVVLTDVLKSNKIVPDSIALSDIHNVGRPSFIMETNRQQMLPYRKDYELAKIKYYRTRSNKRQKCGNLSQTDLKKKQFSISITEIGKCDVNVLEIKTLEQSIGSARRASTTRRKDHSGPANSTRYFTRLSKLEAEQLDGLGGQGKPVESISYIQDNSGNSSDLLKVGGTNTKRAVTKSRSLKTMECQGNESCGAVQVSSLFQKSAAASDWRDVGPVLDSDRELSQKGNNSGLVLLAGALAPAPTLGSGSAPHPGPLAPALVSGSVPLPGPLAPAPALDNSCELEEENTRKFPADTPESQGFVFCEHDESGEGAVDTSIGFMPDFIESVLTDSEDSNNPWLCARLDQSVASVLNYICIGKPL